MGLETVEVTSDADWADAVLVRQEVFVVEQACPPELEWDEHDVPALWGGPVHHLVGRLGNEPVAVLRWRTVMLGDAPAAKIERVAVRTAFRGRGIARLMVARAMSDARAAGRTRFVLHAQAHLADFYSSFGFAVSGAQFVEAGIEHVKMTLTDQ